jgi:magnesium transporter
MPEKLADRVHLQELLRRHPADVAEILSALREEEAVELLRRLYLRRAAAAPLGEMDPEEAARLLAELNRDEAIHILSHMDPDDAVDLLAELPEETVRDILSRLESRKAQMLKALLAYPPDTAGGLMSPEVLALPAHFTAQEAIEEIRRRAEELETVYYAYVVDEENRLLGVLSLRDLVLARPETTLEKIMNREVISLPAEMDVEEVAQIFDKYNFLALPVVDKDRKLLGIVTVDDVMDVMRKEATEDFLRVGGIPAGEDLPLDPPLASVRKRLPWLMGLVLLNMSVAGLVSRFEATIAGPFFCGRAYAPHRRHERQRRVASPDRGHPGNGPGVGGLAGSAQGALEGGPSRPFGRARPWIANWAYRHASLAETVLWHGGGHRFGRHHRGRMPHRRGHPFPL